MSSSRRDRRSGIAILAGGAEGTDTSTSLEGVINSTSPPIYVATRIAVATAVIVTASPDLARPLRLIGRWLIAIGMVSSIALGAALPIGVAGRVPHRVRIGRRWSTCSSAPQAGGSRSTRSPRCSGSSASTPPRRAMPRCSRGAWPSPSRRRPRDGRSLVKVFGRDAQDGQLVAATWYAIWHRGAKRVRAGRLAAGRARGVPDAGRRAGRRGRDAGARGRRDPSGRCVLVLDASARTLGSLEASEIDDERLSGSWRVLGGLHALGISHGHVDATTAGRADDGSAALTDFGAAQVARARGRAEDRPSPAPGDDRARRRHRPCGRRPPPT